VGLNNFASSVIEKIQDDIVIVTIACGQTTVTQLAPWLFSIFNNTNLTQNSIKIKILVDQYGDNFVRPCLQMLVTISSVEIILLEDWSKYKEIDTNGKFHCAFYKLHLTEILFNTSKVIYLDLDTIVQTDISKLWGSFYQNPSKLLFAALEANVAGEGSWYEIHTKKHFYPPTGINTGVLLMNLSAMRKLNITGSSMISNNTEGLLLPDQDVLNSWSHFHQELTGILPCVWNKRLDSHCPNSNHSLGELTNPNGIFHGNRHIFQKKPWNWIPTIYKDAFFSLCNYDTFENLQPKNIIELYFGI
jgi:lipopolysaccharide biosynthesis glycosyltransferase